VSSGSATRPTETNSARRTLSTPSHIALTWIVTVLRALIGAAASAPTSSRGSPHHSNASRHRAYGPPAHTWGETRERGPPHPPPGGSLPPGHMACSRRLGSESAGRLLDSESSWPSPSRRQRLGDLLASGSCPRPHAHAIACQCSHAMPWPAPPNTLMHRGPRAPPPAPRVAPAGTSARLLPPVFFRPSARSLAHRPVFFDEISSAPEHTVAAAALTR
jgi:hypothetical protein